MVRLCLVTGLYSSVRRFMCGRQFHRVVAQGLCLLLGALFLNSATLAAKSKKQYLEQQQTQMQIQTKKQYLEQQQTLEQPSIVESVSSTANSTAVPAGSPGMGLVGYAGG